ncbi:MAG: acetate--CoA ligase family protein [Candidatus Promineifilaceae bacterium]
MTVSNGAIAHSSMQALMAARSVAVVGASPKEGSFGGYVLRNLIDLEFAGAVYPVHPRHGEIFGRKAYPSLSAIPTPPECIALAVANHHLLRILNEAIELGIKAAIVFGDPTVGAGRDPELEPAIAKLARENSMAICGANAMGVYNLPQRFVISGYPVDPEKPAGNVALITHSGTVFDAMSQNNRDVNFNYVVSAGNETSCTAADYLRFVLTDQTTKVVALYLETVRDPQGFIAALELAAEKQIPIVALKTGLTERGQKLAQAHTGALAGGGETYAALFRRYGVRQVRTLDEMMDTVELFSKIQRIERPELAMLMESGGERSMVADHATYIGVAFAEFSAETNTRLTDTLDEGVDPDNPLDAFGTGHAVEQNYRNCLLAMHDDPQTGILVLAVDLARDSYLSHDYVNAALSIKNQVTKPFAAMVNLTAGAHDGLMAQLRANGIPVLMGTETGLRAFKHLIAFNAFLQQPSSEPEFVGRPDAATVAHLRKQLKEATGPLTESVSKRMLGAYGLPVTQEIEANSLEGVLISAETIGYPIVMKTAMPDVMHKSDVGGIYLNLTNADAVTTAYQSLAKTLGERVLVQEMVTGKGVEMILGMTQDPQFGPLLLVGLGGILVEVYRDAVTALPPLSRADAQTLPQQLTGAALLDGVRGRPAADKAALTDALLRFSTFVSDLGDLIGEIDINPLLVRPNGAIMLDALIIPA